MSNSEVLKLTLVGSERSGKTSLVTRILYDEFEPSYTPTVEYTYRHSLVVGLQEYLLDITDISGSSQYESQHDRWFTDADAFIYVFNLADTETLLGIRYFRNQIVDAKKKRGLSLENVPIVVVGTNVDLDKRTVPEDKGHKVGQALGGQYFETSSKADDPVVECEDLSKSIASPRSILHHIVSQLVQNKSFSVLSPKSTPVKRPNDQDNQEARPHSNVARNASWVSTAPGTPTSPSIKQAGRPTPPLPSSSTLTNNTSNNNNVRPTRPDKPSSPQVQTNTNPRISIGGRGVNSDVPSPSPSPSPSAPSRLPIIPAKPLELSENQANNNQNLPSSVPPKLSPAPPIPSNQSNNSSPANSPQIKESSSPVLKNNKIAAHLAQFEKKGMVMGSLTSLRGPPASAPPSTPLNVVPESTTETAQPKNEASRPQFGGPSTPTRTPMVPPVKTSMLGNPTPTPPRENKTNNGVSPIVIPPISVRSDSVPASPADSPRGDKKVEPIALGTPQEITPIAQPSAKQAVDEISNLLPKESTGNSRSPDLERLQRRSMRLLSVDTRTRGGSISSMSVIEGKGLLNGLRAKWAKPMNTLPVFIDFPRLADKVKIIDGPVVKQKINWDKLDSKKGGLSIFKKGKSSTSKKDTWMQVSKSNISSSPPTNSPIKNAPVPTKEPEDEEEEEVAQLCQVKVRLGDWVFTITVDDSHTAVQLMEEISVQASHQLTTIAGKLDKSKAELDAKLNGFQSEVFKNFSGPSNVAILARSLVQVMDNRIEDAFIVSVTQTPETTDELKRICGRLKDIQRDLITVAISTIRNSASGDTGTYEESKRHFKELVDEVRQLSNQLMITRQSVKIVQLKLDGQPILPTEIASNIDGLEIEAIDGSQASNGQPTKYSPRTQINLSTSTDIISQDEKLATLLGSKPATSTSRPTTPRSADTPPSAPAATVQPENKQRRVMQEVMCNLATLLDEEELAQKVKSEIGNYVKNSGDTSRQLSKFLEEILSEKDKLSRILKCINQSIIAAPYIQLKTAWPTKYPFEDVGTSWVINVNIVKGKEVVVTHRKLAAAGKDLRNKGKDDKIRDEPGFEFAWELIIRFDWEVSRMNEATFKTCDIKFDNNYPDRAKKKVMKAYNQFAHFF